MEKIKNSPKVLGLDVSTKTIGWALFDYSSKDLLELTHFSPKIKPLPDYKIEQLLLKAVAFSDVLKKYVGVGIVKVIIEEPLLRSNKIRMVKKCYLVGMKKVVIRNKSCGKKFQTNNHTYLGLTLETTHLEKKTLI